MNRTERFYVGLGKRIEELRREKKLTQERLGLLLSPPQTRSSLSNIEAGKQRVLAHTLTQIAAALGTTTDDLAAGPSSARESMETKLGEQLTLNRDQLRELVARLRSQELGSGTSE